MFRYPTTTPILPALYTFGMKKRPILGGTVFPSVSGKEYRTLSQAFPLWEFELTFDGLRTETENVEEDRYQHYAGLTDYEKISAVFLACKGRYGRFFYRDLSDYSRVEQLVGFANGSRTEFRVVRTIGTGGLGFIEPVGGVDLASFIPIVKVNGVVRPQEEWYIDGNDLQTLVFFSAPGTGAVLLTFWFFYYCRFVDDTLELEEFLYNLHRNNSFKFRSTKDCREDAPNPWFFP